MDYSNEEWREDAPVLAAIEASEPFTVPDNYFSESSDLIQARVRICEADLSESAFEVPDTYFNELEDHIFSSIRLDAFKDSAANQGFETPAGYFGELRTDILARVNQENSGSIRNLGGAWLKYAAAACITLVIGAGLILYNRHPNLDKQLSRIPEEEIVDYLQTYSVPGDGEIILEHLEKNNALPDNDLNLSEQEIEQYLESAL